MNVRNLPTAALESIERSTRLADRVFLSWLGFRQTGRIEPPGHRDFRETMALDASGTLLRHVVGGEVKRTLSRQDLPRFLTTPEMEEVTQAEVEMEDLVREWEDVTHAERGLTRTGVIRLAEIADGLTAHIRRITQLLSKLGFTLDDHYHAMRAIAEN